MKTLPVRGCRDYLPKEMELRGQVLDKILRAYKNNGFLQVKTPILENLENLSGGDSGDNTKMMFKTVKRGAQLNLNKPNLTEKDIVEEGLRYDLTVPLARLFTGNRDNLPMPFKAIQIDESFRAEKPQEGRNRQFTQCDIDIWGEKSIMGEIEIITTVMEGYNAVGLPNVICRISSRKILVQLVLNAGFKQEDVNDVCIIIDKLEKIGVSGCENELSAKGYNQKAIKLLSLALADIQQNGISALGKYNVDPSDIEDMNNLLKVVSPLLPKGYSIKFDISIVRGQGYYTGFVFEMYCYDSGYRGAIGGGGRYDKMYEKFAGSELPAVGFGLGLDSVLLVLNKLGKDSVIENKKLALVYDQAENLSDVIAMKNSYKKQYDVSTFPRPKNFKEFMRKIKINGFTHLVTTSRKVIEEI